MQMKLIEIQKAPAIAGAFFLGGKEIES